MPINLAGMAPVAAAVGTVAMVLLTAVPIVYQTAMPLQNVASMPKFPGPPVRSTRAAVSSASVGQRRTFAKVQLSHSDIHLQDAQH